MTVERLQVETVVPMSRTKPPVFAPEEKPNALLSTFNSLLPIFSALAAVLAVRLFLLFAIIGAFDLAYMAMTDSDNHKIAVCVFYDLLVVFPLVWLDIQGKKK